MTTPDRRRGRPPVVLACATCGAAFEVAAPRQHTAKYCSVACRAAAGRVTATCRHCGQQASVKKAVAVKRIFCSRACMFAAWGCARCNKLVPTERRALGIALCSDRCDAAARRDADHEQTGVLHARCPRCQRTVPADAFHHDSTNRNGLSNRCKDCQRDDYERNKIDYRRRRFGYQAADPARVLPFTQEEQDARWAMWGGRCWVCGVADATEEDHVKPLSAGGWHCLANLRPACKPCNASKQGAWPLPAASLRPAFRHPAPRPGSDAEQRTPRQPRQEHTCEHCGAVRLVRAHAARTLRFCSPACKNAARTRPPVIVTCLGCGTAFDLPGHEASKQRKFCSTACAYSSGKRAKGGRRKASPGKGQGALW